MREAEKSRLESEKRSVLQCKKKYLEEISRKRNLFGINKVKPFEQYYWYWNIHKAGKK